MHVVVVIAAVFVPLFTVPSSQRDASAEDL